MSLWSLDKTAINTGYGMIHPEYLMAGPYGTRRTIRASRGGGSRLAKGSPEAKARMAYLRSLRGKGLTYNDAALRGGVYNTAALYGGEGPGQEIVKQLQDTGKHILDNGEKKIKEMISSGSKHAEDYANQLLDAGKKRAEAEAREYVKRITDTLTDPEKFKAKKLRLKEKLSAIKAWFKKKFGKKGAGYCRGGSGMKTINRQILQSLAKQKQRDAWRKYMDDQRSLFY